MNAPTDRGCSIQVNLSPEWKDAVARHPLTQQQVNTAIKNMGRHWLDGCGFDAIFDIDNCGCDKDESKPPGPNAEPLYATHSIRIQWGAWGPEHITVPGDACGLDLSSSIGGYRDGMSLLPHNVDNIRQAYLLLLIFTWFADHIIAGERSK